MTKREILTQLVAAQIIAQEGITEYDSSTQRYKLIDTYSANELADEIIKATPKDD